MENVKNIFEFLFNYVQSHILINLHKCFEIEA